MVTLCRIWKLGAMKLPLGPTDLTPLRLLRGQAGQQTLLRRLLNVPSGSNHPALGPAPHLPLPTADPLEGVKVQEPSQPQSQRTPCRQAAWLVPGETCSAQALPDSVGFRLLSSFPSSFQTASLVVWMELVGQEKRDPKWRGHGRNYRRYLL